MLTRLKVAAALAILDGHDRVRDEDWTLAGVVIRESDRTRARIEHALAERARETNRARAEAKADEAAILDDRADARLRERARQGVIRCLSRRGRVSIRDLSKSLRVDVRQHLEQTLAELLDARVIRETVTNDRRFYELVDAA